MPGKWYRARLINSPPHNDIEWMFNKAVFVSGPNSGTSILFKPMVSEGWVRVSARPSNSCGESSSWVSKVKSLTPLSGEYDDSDKYKQ